MAVERSRLGCAPPAFARLASPPQDSESGEPAEHKRPQCLAGDEVRKRSQAQTGRPKQRASKEFRANRGRAATFRDASMLTLSQLSKSFGARDLFKNVTLQLNPGSRYGLVGANGSGKSTLLNILGNLEAPSDGQVLLPKEAHLGILRQDQFNAEALTVLDIAMMGDPRAWPFLSEQRSLIVHTDSDAERIAELEEQIALNDGYTLEARASAILSGLGLSADAQRGRMGALSGGFRLRVLLGQVLVGRPDVLLLDEPTNHLDILSIRWLEKFLVDYAGCLVVISHDQRFLDHVTTHILDVDYGTVTPYTGNYSAFLAQKHATAERMSAEAARVEKVIAEKRAFVERFRAKATKARQAQSRAKQLERIEVPEVKHSSRRTPKFEFPVERVSGKDVLDLELVSKSYGANRVLVDVSFQLRKGERVAVIGPNGIGKSTLLKIIADVVAADAGAHTWGHATKIGYFPQNHNEVLEAPSQSALDFLWAFRPSAATSEIRGRLGKLLFSGEDVNKRLGMLSGGEAARLVFGKLAIEEPNVLLLDEPTNHLDLESIEALAAALRRYDGTLLFVSHDRWFVSALATRIIELTPDGYRDFPGTFEEYLGRCGDDHLDAVAAEARRKEEQRGAREQKGALQEARDASKRLRNRLKSIPQQRDAVLARIETAEARLREVQELYCSAGFFEHTPSEQVAQLQLEEQSLRAQVDTWMSDWESLEEELCHLRASGAV